MFMASNRSSPAGDIASELPRDLTLRIGALLFFGDAMVKVFLSKRELLGASTSWRPPIKDHEVPSCADDDFLRRPDR